MKMLNILAVVSAAITFFPFIALASDDVLGARDATKIQVTLSDGKALCESFSFSQLPENANLFIGKYVPATAGNLCGGQVTLALFKFDWRTKIMTLVHPLLQLPVQLPVELDGAVISAAYDPYVVKFKGENWVAFECTGAHIAGASSCIAPLVGLDHLDVSRLTIPVSGEDADTKSLYVHSASTPKLLSVDDRLFMYWTAVQVEKAPPHTWISLETRGVELTPVQQSGKSVIWSKPKPFHHLPSFTPGGNVVMMSPDSSDKFRNVSVDTEGLFVDGNDVYVFSSVGGTGTGNDVPCVKPRLKSTRCFHLEVTKTTKDKLLTENAFNSKRLIAPKLPSNPTEYPRVVDSGDGKKYLMVNTHATTGATKMAGDDSIEEGYLVIPLDLSKLKFGDD